MLMCAPPSEIGTPDVVPVSLGPATPRGPLAPPPSPAPAPQLAGSGTLAGATSDSIALQPTPRVPGASASLGASAAPTGTTPASSRGASRVLKTPRRGAQPPAAPQRAASPETAIRAAIKAAAAQAAEEARSIEAERSRQVEAEAVESLAKQHRAFTMTTHAAVALFAAASFAQSLILALRLRTASRATLTSFGLSTAARHTLRDLLGFNLFFSAAALALTLLLVVLGSARPDNPAARATPGLRTKMRHQFGLEDESHIGWLVKALNALAMVSAFAVAVTTVSVGAFYTAPPVGS